MSLSPKLEEIVSSIEKSFEIKDDFLV
ncbi:hypothetical protein I503_06123, partial [Candida albicans SC5314]